MLFKSRTIAALTGIAALAASLAANPAEARPRTRHHVRHHYVHYHHRHYSPIPGIALGLFGAALGAAVADSYYDEPYYYGPGYNYGPGYYYGGYGRPYGRGHRAWGGPAHFGGHGGHWHH